MVSDWSENITADEGFALTMEDEIDEDHKIRINMMPVNKPFNRRNYKKPKSMIEPSNRYSYINIRRKRLGFASKIGQK